MVFIVDITDKKHVAIQCYNVAKLPFWLSQSEMFEKSKSMFIVTILLPKTALVLHVKPVKVIGRLDVLIDVMLQNSGIP